MMLYSFKFHNGDIDGRDHGCICISKCLTLGQLVVSWACRPVFRMGFRCLAVDVWMICILYVDVLRIVVWDE